MGSFSAIQATLVEKIALLRVTPCLFAHKLQALSGWYFKGTQNAVLNRFPYAIIGEIIKYFRNVT